ncbi:CHAT domain-containing protein [Streptomyces sp. NPDC056056]|uniref:CHAT domain-containing protein n=1 Tax=Streptomyces sp. NPDC056056 TaxID=3345698 RepID=UPI0035E07959
MSQEMLVWQIRQRAEALDDVAVLDRATELAATLVDHTPVGHERRRLRLAMGAELLVLRFEWAGRFPQDLEVACEMAGLIPEAPPGELRLAPYILNVRAQAWYMLGNARGDTAALRQVLQVLDEPRPPAVLDAGHQQLFDAQACSLRGLAELALFRHTGEGGLLEGAVEHARRAVETFPEASDLPVDPGPARAVLRVNLGETLRYRHHQNGAESDLTDAFDALTRALGELPVSHPALAIALTNLGGILQAAYHAQGDPDLLVAAVDQFRKVLTATGSADSRLPQRRSNLVLALLMVHDYTGGHEPLHEAVALARQAVIPGDWSGGHLSAHTDVYSAGMLGAALVRRGDLLHEAADFAEAVDVLLRAAAVPAEGDPELPDLLKLLADAHFARYDAFDDPADLEAATATAQRMLSLPHIYRTDEVQCLTQLARFRTRAAARHAPGAPDSARAQRAELDAAVSVHRRLVSLTGSDAFDAVARAVGLCDALGKRYRLTGDPQDLTDALALSAAAALNERAGEYDRLAALRLYAELLWDKTERDGDPADLRQAMALWKITAESPLLTPEARVQDARRRAAGAASLGDWSEATDALTGAVALLPQLAWHGTGWSSRENVLERLAGLASDAAACAIRADRPREALTLLERGRSVLWRQVLHFRADLTTLREEHPDLVRDLEETREAMRRGGGTGRFLPAPRDGDGPDTRMRGPEVDRHMALARRWDDLVAQVRALPGQEEFLRVPPFAGVPEHGPDLAVLNVSDYGCHALLVRGGAVTALPLATTLAEVSGHTQRFLDAVDSPEAGDPAAPERDGSLAGGELPADVAADTLAWLYETVAGPVLDTFGVPDRAPDGRDAPRIIWSPTGPLTFLPLHAAGLHTTRHHAAPRTVMDRAVSSYSPSLESVSDDGGAQGVRSVLPPSGRGLLVVDVGDLPQPRDLPGAKAEADLLEDLFPEALRLSGVRADRDSVLRGLDACSWAHFACHGAQTVDDPSAAGLVLHGEEVSLADLSRARRTPARLAFLSACDTFRGGGRVADESLTLATGLRTAGWHDVVAAVYQADDAVSGQIVHAVYAGLAAGRPVHEALHEAVLRWRDILPVDPRPWAHFVHIGP